MAIFRQNSVRMYGSGPYDPDTKSHPGCCDIANIEINKHYVIVQVDELDRLEQIVEQGLDNYQSGFAAGYAARDAEVQGALV